MKVKKIFKKNPGEPGEAPKLYASAIHGEKVDINGLATAVANRCSLRRADVHGVLVALMDIIPEELTNGKIVALGDLGTFCVNVKSDGVVTPEEFTPSVVKGTKILYRPTKELKKKLRMIDVTVAN